ncbi:proteasome subunit alpha type-1-like [Teleopsis dalmanni]|uniref:proteasome subunit alpha type-1-like n=1 Tax=Teleopsis dalmanni TaxID=139649 RepID=UPI0018CD3153|nr:proteasome subunit alpha type-1-like [Teleopsis dalmanni]XP_037943105.1 proteasome subunit alpha type-1-like [Teleopsis dalmanni]
MSVPQAARSKTQNDTDLLIRTLDGKTDIFHWAMESENTQTASVALKNRSHVVLITIEHPYLPEADHPENSRSRVFRKCRHATQINVRFESENIRYKNDHLLDKGFLMIGDGGLEPNIFHVLPPSNIYECDAMAVGHRSKNARDYLARHSSEFQACDKTVLICHGIKALKSTLADDENMSDQHISIITMRVNDKYNYLNQGRGYGMIAILPKCLDY